MPNKNYKSPFATSFKSAVKRGTSYNVAVENIASKNKKTVQFVWESLWKAGLANRQKFNGQWLYWPANVTKANAKTWKHTQWNAWQWFVEWALTTGNVTPEQLNKLSNQKDFMTFCKKFWGKQYTWNTPKKVNRAPKAKTSRRRPTTKSSARKRSNVKRTNRKSTTTRGRTTAKRSYRRAA